MDYDKTSIAAVYDTGRSYDPKVLKQWLDLLSAYVPKESVSRIVDLGCGTGRFSEPLSIHFDADVIGIDPSEKMLEQARTKSSRGTVVFKKASGEKLPVDDRTSDMVFMSMAFHHLADPEQTARESRRILCDGGYVCIRNVTVDAIETFPYIRFFPGIRSLMEEQLASRGQIKSIFEGAGFDTVAHKAVTHRLSTNWRSFADKMAMRADSFSARLQDDAFHTGMTELRAHAKRADPGEPVTEEVDLFVFQR